MSDGTGACGVLGARAKDEMNMTLEKPLYPLRRAVSCTSGPSYRCQWASVIMRSSTQEQSSEDTLVCMQLGPLLSDESNQCIQPLWGSISDSHRFEYPDLPYENRLSVHHSGHKLYWAHI
jgi:hypothetical protein